MLVGTLYPLVTEVLGQKISVGAPYFNSAAGYPALVLVIVMIMGPVMRWRRDEFNAVMKRIALPLLATALNVAWTCCWRAPISEYYRFLGFCSRLVWALAVLLRFGSATCAGHRFLLMAW